MSKLGKQNSMLIFRSDIAPVCWLAFFILTRILCVIWICSCTVCRMFKEIKLNFSQMILFTLSTFFTSIFMDAERQLNWWYHFFPLKIALELQTKKYYSLLGWIKCRRWFTLRISSDVFRDLKINTKIKDQCNEKFLV